MRLPLDIQSVKGFLHPDEGRRLHDLALHAASLGPVLEVGSYCGKSTVYLGTACRAAGGVLLAVDHHRGSEEHQLGEAYHDPALYDADVGAMDSFRAFRQTLAEACLEDVVVPIVASSELAGRALRLPLSMVFIDGGHSLAAAQTDYLTWATQIVSGGVLAIHDIFEDPADGGQAPHQIYQLAIASELFVALEKTRTLGVLKRR